MLLIVHWIKLLFAAFLEVLWVIGLTHAYNFWTWAGTVFAIIVSNYILIVTAQKLPAGTVYSVYVGLGTAGTVIADILFFGEPFKWEVILFIIMLFAGVIGLQWVTEERKEKGGSV